MQPDHVFIRRMEVSCSIGTSEQERAFPQVIIISARIFFPLQRAGQLDSLNETIDYALFAQDIRTRLQQRKYVLAEAVAEDIAKLALNSALAKAVEVDVEKRVLEGIASVGVSIRREK